MPIDMNYPTISISAEGHKADSAHHTAYGYVLRSLNGTIMTPRLELFFDPETGRGRRHPTRSTKDFTRDQFTPFLAYYAIVAKLPEVDRMYKLVVENNGFFFNEEDTNGVKKPWWNRDILDPQTRSMYHRAHNTKRYMHYIGDVLNFANILFKDVFQPDNNADENIIMHLLVANKLHPTFISDLAYRYYFTSTKKDWRDKVKDFWDRDGTYYPELVPLTITTLVDYNRGVL